MFDEFYFNTEKVYPTIVVSTMSSGKSTLINSLIGQDLLPKSNKACTAKAVGILGKDKSNFFNAKCTNVIGKTFVINKIDNKKLRELNNNEDFSELMIEGPIKFSKNLKKSLFIIDTPGINNILNDKHGKITNEIISEFREGLIIYVINSQQIGTYDDESFLELVGKKLKANKNCEVLVVVNKLDDIDTSVENIEELLNNCKKYINSHGIDNVKILPISAYGALLFKKVLNNEKLSEFDEENFPRYINIFKKNILDLDDCGCLQNKSEVTYSVDGFVVSSNELNRALNNTGILHLERELKKRVNKK